MYLADTVRFAAFAIGGVLGLYGLWVMIFGLWPERVASCVQRLERGIWRYFFLGLLPVLPILVLGTKIGSGALLPVGLTLLIGQCGVAAIALHVGRRIVSGNANASDASALLKGGLALALAILFPFVGWIAILLFLTTTGIGLWMASFRKMKDLGNEAA